MKIRLDLARCQGYGNCVFAAPQVFDLDDAGKAVVLVEDPTDEHIAAVRDAVADCPARAIELAG